MPDDKPPLHRQSDAWVSGLRPWLLARIEELRDELERPGQNVEEMRGRIGELRDLIRKIEPDAAEPGSSSRYFEPSREPS